MLSPTELLIEPLNLKKINQAIEIAVEATVGERKDIGKDMFKNLDKKTDRYFAAIKDGAVVAEIGWYQDKIVSEVKNKGGKFLWVYTSRAKKFYEKCGFEFVKKGYMDECWQDFLRKDLQGETL